MQCTSCSFENMPGVPACGRCGARLGLAAMAIDVHPPRATPRMKRLRRWFPGYGLFLRLRNGVVELRGRVARLGVSLRERLAALARVHWTHRGISYPIRQVLLRIIIPGWPQIYTGQRVRGFLLLGAFLGLLALAMSHWGTDAGTSLLVLALAVHAASVIDVLCAATTDPQARVIFAVICAVFLGAVVYFPILWMLTRLVVLRVR